jgi:tetratricopeptide (TPR) repeat protein
MTNPYSAKDYFYNKDYKTALKMFLKEENYYGAGLCSMLLCNTNRARVFWSINKNCPASKWGLCVLDFIKLKREKKPTFFQTRAQLEIYLNLLIENNLIEWAQNLVSCCDILFQANPESYKFIARALYANGYFKIAIDFCKKSLRYFYSDPEAFLIMGQCQFLLGDIAEALDSTNRTLAIAPAYYPAKLFRAILKKEIEKRRAESA